MASSTTTAKHAAAKRSLGLLPTGGKHAARPSAGPRRALASARLAR